MRLRSLVTHRDWAHKNWRGLGALLLALTFLTQSYFLQTHIHSLHFQSTLGFSTPQSPQDDPANCPICQADMLGGHFVLPPLPLLPPQQEIHHFAPAPPQLELLRAHHVHPWQGRAPPIL